MELLGDTTGWKMIKAQKIYTKTFQRKEEKKGRRGKGKRKKRNK